MLILHKYTAIGNDYLLLDARQHPLPEKETILRVCDRHWGIGSDGLLWGGLQQGEQFPLKIFNPDGSEAEKSGNGIRIFAQFLWDSGYAKTPCLLVKVSSGEVLCQRNDVHSHITTAMGKPQWESPLIPSPCDFQLELDGQTLNVHAVSMGNPHAVIDAPSWPLDCIKRYGPLLEIHPLFPEKTNVQMLHIVDRQTIDLQIWERGAAYTLASGSSACAAFAVARKLHRCDRIATLRMPGGNLQIEEMPDGTLVQSGTVTRIADCYWYDQYQSVQNPLKNPLKKEATSWQPLKTE